MKGARNLPQVNIKMPLEVKEKIQQRAEESLRSMNSEIVARLVQSLELDDRQQNAAH